MGVAKEVEVVNAAEDARDEFAGLDELPLVWKTEDKVVGVPDGW